jgi:hypothetical protein
MIRLNPTNPVIGEKPAGDFDTQPAEIMSNAEQYKSNSPQ